MADAALIDIAIDAAQDLEGVARDVDGIKGQLDIIRDLLDQQLSSNGQVVEMIAETQTAAPSPELGINLDDLMAFQYMQTVIGVFVLVALFLNIGATLWLAFSDKWRV